MKKQAINYETGEITEMPLEKLNQVIIEETKRPNGTTRIRFNYKNCPTMAEQHTAHLTDINYLIERYKPDELAAYIAARAQYKQEIIGHDFSQEPDLQGAQNIVYKSKQEFEKLDDKIKMSFKNHLEFLKFIDNADNADKMLELGILTKKQITNLQTPTLITTPETDAVTKNAKDKA